MIPKEQEAQILRLHRVEGWPVGTIATQLGVHHDVVERVIAQKEKPHASLARATILDPFLPFVEETLRRWPTLRASRLFDMCVARGYRGGPSHFRHRIRELRPRPAAEAYLRLATLPGEEAQVDWGHFGRMTIGRASRPLMGFVMVLSWSRAIYLRFFSSAKLACFLRGHVAALEWFGGSPRVVLYDNLKSAVLARIGDALQMHPGLVELASHYCFEPRPVAVARGNEKGRVERAIRFVRDSFFAARRWRDLDDLNAQAMQWCEGRSLERPWPQDRTKSVRDALAEERERLVSLPETRPATDEVEAVTVGKQPYVRFDENDYSVPHDFVRRTLTVAADEERVRILDGADEVSSHARSFGKGETIELAVHVEDLVREKRRARKGRATSRLLHAAPTMEKLLAELARRGENLGSLVNRFGELLAIYGGQRLERAAREALLQGAPHPRSVRLILERERIEEGRPPIVPVDLPDDPKVRGIRVRPHDLASYDALFEGRDDQPEGDGAEGGESHGEQ
jgi:transposase